MSNHFADVVVVTPVDLLFEFVHENLVSAIGILILLLLVAAIIVNVFVVRKKDASKKSQKSSENKGNDQ